MSDLFLTRGRGVPGFVEPTAPAGLTAHVGSLRGRLDIVQDVNCVSLLYQHSSGHAINFANVIPQYGIWLMTREPGAHLPGLPALWTPDRGDGASYWAGARAEWKFSEGEPPTFLSSLTDPRDRDESFPVFLDFQRFYWDFADRAPVAILRYNLPDRNQGIPIVGFYGQPENEYVHLFRISPVRRESGGKFLPYDREGRAFVYMPCGTTRA